jgi:phospholipase C
MDRRDFIKMLGLAGTSAAAYTACSAYMEEALAQSTVIDDLLSAAAHCKLGSLKDIEHVIFLMQENRSFDHYYGTMRGVRGFGDPRPLRLRNGNPVFTQANGARKVIKPFQVRRGEDSAGDYKSFGLAHGYVDGAEAIARGWNDNWIAAKNNDSLAMAHLETKKDLSFYHKLVEAFTICDSYHCSVHGPTEPNRSYYFTGTARGWTSHEYFSGTAKSGQAPDWKSYPERLQELGVSWKFYKNDLTVGSDHPNDFFSGVFSNNTLRFFKQFKDKNNEFAKRLAINSSVLRHSATPEEPSQFEADVRNGNLPAVSWVVANGAFHEHPTSTTPHFGEFYVNEILKALVAYPEVWKKTVFILNYDENDGFFDHVPPPLPPLPALAPAPDKVGGTEGVGKVSAGISIPKTDDVTDVDAEHMTKPRVDSAKTLGLGSRVPCLIVSPWTAGGRICSELFDHTSTLRFLDAWLAAKGLQPDGTVIGNISSWRRAICGDLTSAFDFTRSGAEIARQSHAQLSEATKSVESVTTYVKPADKGRFLNSLPKYTGKDADIAIDQKRETRSKQDKTQVALLPLGYDFNVFSRIIIEAGKPDKLQLTFRNRGSIGVALNAYSYVKEDEGRGAWFYALAKAAKPDAPVEVIDAYDLARRGGKYEFAVHAPNGYLSEFRGDANDANQRLIADIVDVRAEANATKVRFDFGAWPKDNGELTMINAYTGDTVTVAARTASISTATRDGWYDVAFIDKAGTNYLRRYAGHLENGVMSKTDPAIGTGYDAKRRLYDWVGA